MISEKQIFDAFPRQPWDHQLQGVTRVLRALGDIRSVCLSAVTGSGKSLMQAAIVNLCLDAGHGVVIYNARRGLTSQISQTFEEAGIHHGARAASMKSKKNLQALVQVGSIQTDIQRVIKQSVWQPHRAKYVIVDEAHMPNCKSDQAMQLFQRYLAQGARIIGMTGTPIGLSDVYKDVIDLVPNSEMRRIGAHVPAETYCIHEMDTSRIKPVKTGEFREGDIRRECWSPAIVGHALNDWERLNPDRKPTLASCPGVKESVWVHNQWMEKGYRVAHVDANEVLVNGERQRGSDAREEVLADARKGRFHLITNCEVLLAGIDIKNLEHLIMLRPFGSLANYIQFVGRGIRASEGKEKCVIQDHVGNSLRWGSANEDRPWNEYFYETEKEIYDKEVEKKQKAANEDRSEEPTVCGKCGKVRAEGYRCPACGHASNRSERCIVQQDGQLILQDGPVYKKQKPKVQKSVEQKTWEQLYWSARKGKFEQSFSQLRARYAQKLGGDALKHLATMPYTPKDKDGWKSKVKDLPWSDLN